LHQRRPEPRRPRPKDCLQRPRTKLAVAPADPSSSTEDQQVDFKVEIPMADGTWINLHAVRDPVGEATIGAFVYATPQRTKRVSLEQV
jgi:hypothetical protein